MKHVTRLVAVLVMVLSIAQFTPCPNAQTSMNTPTALLKKQTVTVYITRTGVFHHKDGGRYLRQSQIVISKASAIKNGYCACSICSP